MSSYIVLLLLRNYFYEGDDRGDDRGDDGGTEGGDDRGDEPINTFFSKCLRDINMEGAIYIVVEGYYDDKIFIPFPQDKKMTYLIHTIDTEDETDDIAVLITVDKKPLTKCTIL